MIRSHYIRSNEANRIPRRWIYWDTEAREVSNGGTKVQTWRCGVTCYERWNPEKKRWTRPQWATHNDPGLCWDWITAHISRDERTVLVAHNVAYDLRIGQAFHYLPALGWHLDSFNVGERSCSLAFRQGPRTLVIIDSYSWLPTSLARIGSMVGTPKLELPDMAASDDEWEQRCATDVAILREAYRNILDWIRDEDLGNWQRTGAGQSWATWRHRFMHAKVLVHDDEEAQEAEAAASYTGRCEAWRHGLLTQGHYTEWDLPLAYPRVALDTDLPYKLIGRRRGANWRYVTHETRGRRYLVRATVDTPAPVLPTTTDKGVVWPIGRVEGWYWDCELLAADDAGARITAHEMLCYAARPFLTDWAAWVIDVADKVDPASNDLRALAAKHQSRALIGRFASKHQAWQSNGPAIEPGVDMHKITDADTGVTGQVLVLGDESWVSWESTYADNAMVAVMSAVMAECRVRLWQLMLVAGLGNVVYVDTDSLITNPIGSARIKAHIDSGQGWGIRSKGKHRVLEILGPRQLSLGAEVRAAGMPKQPFLIAGHRFGGAHWENLTTALNRGHAGEVHIRQATWSMSGVDNRREHMQDGSTRARMLVNPWLDPGRLRTA